MVFASRPEAERIHIRILHHETQPDGLANKSRQIGPISAGRAIRATRPIPQQRRRSPRQRRHCRSTPSGIVIRGARAGSAGQSR